MIFAPSLALPRYHLKNVKLIILVDVQVKLCVCGRVDSCQSDGEITVFDLGCIKLLVNN